MTQLTAQQEQTLEAYVRFDDTVQERSPRVGVMRSDRSGDRTAFCVPPRSGCGSGGVRGDRFRFARCRIGATCWGLGV